MKHIFSPGMSKKKTSTCELIERSHFFPLSCRRHACRPPNLWLAAAGLDFARDSFICHSLMIMRCTSNMNIYIRQNLVWEIVPKLRTSKLTFDLGFRIKCFCNHEYMASLSLALSLSWKCAIMTQTATDLDVLQALGQQQYALLEEDRCRAEAFSRMLRKDTTYKQQRKNPYCSGTQHAPRFISIC